MLNWNEIFETVKWRELDEMEREGFSGASEHALIAETEDLVIISDRVDLGNKGVPQRYRVFHAFNEEVELVDSLKLPAHCL